MNYPKPLPGGRTEREQAIRTHLRRWNRNILETLFGKKFYARNADNRFLFVAVVETGLWLGKEHLHLLIRVPQDKQELFEARAANLWPGTSDIHIERIHDVHGAVRYVTKDIRPDGVILSNELRSGAA